MGEKTVKIFLVFFFHYAFWNLVYLLNTVFASGCITGDCGVCATRENQDILRRLAWPVPARWTDAIKTVQFWKVRMQSSTRSGNGT